MHELFQKKDVEKLLHNKFVLILGSSVQRSMYKDLVKILTKESYMNDNELRAKGELKYQGDELLDGGKKAKLTNSINYREVREYKTDFHLIRFYFITRCYNKYVESLLSEIKKNGPEPDIVIVNSCLWDITRYGLGTDSVEAYRKNLHSLCEKLKEVLPSEALVMWNSTLPVDKNAKGGVFVPEIENAKSQLDAKILASNLIAHHVMSRHGYDYIDLHFFLRHHLHRRAEDGVHWDMTAHRRMTNLILHHVSEAWGVEYGQMKQYEALENANQNQNPLLKPADFAPSTVGPNPLLKGLNSVNQQNNVTKPVPLLDVQNVLQQNGGVSQNQPSKPVSVAKQSQPPNQTGALKKSKKKKKMRNKNPNYQIPNPVRQEECDFTSDVNFNKHTGNFLQHASAFQWNSNINNQFFPGPPPRTHLPRPFHPNYQDETPWPDPRVCQDNYKYTQNEYHGENASQNFHWQEYPQENLQTGYGAHGYRHNTMRQNRFQPYATNHTGSMYGGTQRGMR